MLEERGAHVLAEVVGQLEEVHAAALDEVPQRHVRRMVDRVDVGVLLGVRPGLDRSFVVP